MGYQDVRLMATAAMIGLFAIAPTAVFSQTGESAKKADAPIKNVISKIGNNESVYIDGQSFEVATGRAKAKDDAAALIRKFRATPLPQGAIVFRVDDTLYLANGAPAMYAVAYEPAAGKSSETKRYVYRSTRIPQPKYPDPSANVVYMYPDPGSNGVAQKYPDPGESVLYMYPDPGASVILQKYPDPGANVVQMYPDPSENVVYMYPDPGASVILQKYPDPGSNVIQVYPDPGASVLQKNSTSAAGQSLNSQQAASMASRINPTRRAFNEVFTW